MNTDIKKAVLYRVVDGLFDFKGYVPNQFGFLPESLGYKESKKKFESQYTIIGFEEFINDIFITVVVEKNDYDDQSFVLNLQDIFENILQDEQLSQSLFGEEKRIFDNLFARFEEKRNAFSNEVVLGNFNQRLKEDNQASLMNDLDQRTTEFHMKIVNMNKGDKLEGLADEIRNACADLNDIQSTRHIVKFPSHKAVYYFLARHCPNEIDLFLQAFKTKGKNLEQSEIELLKKRITAFEHELIAIEHKLDFSVSFIQEVFAKALNEDDKRKFVINIIKLCRVIDQSCILKQIFDEDDRIDDLIEMTKIIVAIQNPSRKISNIEREIICRRFERKLKPIVEREVQTGSKRKLKEDIFDFMQKQNFSQMTIREFKEKCELLFELYNDLIEDILNEQDRIRNFYWLEKHYHMIFYHTLAAILVEEKIAQSINKYEFLIKIMNLALSNTYLYRTNSLKRIVSNILRQYYKAGGDWNNVQEYWKIRSEITALRILKYRILGSIENLSVNENSIHEAWVEISRLCKEDQSGGLLKGKENQTYYEYLKLFLENNNRITKKEYELMIKFIIR